MTSSLSGEDAPSGEDVSSQTAGSTGCNLHDTPNAFPFMAGLYAGSDTSCSSFVNAFVLRFLDPTGAVINTDIVCSSSLDELVTMARTLAGVVWEPPAGFAGTDSGYDLCAESCAAQSTVVRPGAAAGCGLGLVAPAAASAESRAALVRLYEATGGAGWDAGPEGDRRAWLDGDDPCRWNGVNCNVDGSVRELVSISMQADVEFHTGDGYRRITGTIPTEIGTLTSLSVLMLGANALSGTLPTELGLLTSLWALVLQGSQYIGPAAIDDSRMGNQISGTLPTELGRLSQLTQIALYHNRLSGTIPAEAFGTLTSMVGLRLGQNAISGSIPSQVCVTLA